MALTPSVPADSDASAVRVRGLSKTFGNIAAIRDVNLEVQRGSVHALMGGNGSGKSTLIKCLTGYYQPDPGSAIHISGDHSSASAIAVVHQDLGLVPDLTVMENMALGRGFQTNRGGVILWRRHRRNVQRQLAEYGVDVSADAVVRELSPSQRASVAIARALADRNEVRLLILDEPTASLPERERRALLEVVRAVARTGAGVLYVSHRIPEVFEISDTISVLRDGRLVRTSATADLTEADVVHAMMGRPVLRDGIRSGSAGGEMLLRAEGISGPGLEQFDLDVRAGEIVGVTGILGAGQTQVGRLLFGAQMRAAGTVRIGPAHVRPGDPSSAMRAGLAYVPQDRVNESTIPSLRVRENLMLLALRSLRSRGMLNVRRERATARARLDQYDVRPRDPELAIAQLSGGNQQKVVIAKWLASDPRVLIVDEPTHGVDVAAREAIYRHLGDAADRGTGIVLIDTDVDELVRLCERVVVLSSGRIVGELTGEALDRDAVVALTQGMRVTA